MLISVFIDLYIGMEVSYPVFEVVQCCLSLYKDKHFLKKPTKLPCGHYACFDCIDAKLGNAAIKEIECFNSDCRKKHDLNDLKDLIIDFDVELIIKNNLKDLFNILKLDFNQIYEDFNSMKSLKC